MKATEAEFEEYVAGWLVEHGGYAEVKGPGSWTPSAFDPVIGIDTADLFAFIGATQTVQWDRLIALHGGDPSVAQSKFGQRLSDQLDARGTVDVLRHGVTDRGVTLQLACFRPAHGLTPELVERAGPCSSASPMTARCSVSEPTT